MKKGFTIAEVLIALAIVGVVAALTIPALVKNYQKQVWGTSLAAAVSDFENAMSTMIMRDGATDMYGTKLLLNLEEKSDRLESNTDKDIINTFVEDISTILKIESVYDIYDFYKNDPHYMEQGWIGDDQYFERSIFLKTSKGYTYSILVEPIRKDQNKEADVLALGGNLYNVVASVYIDVNSENKPNHFGYDVFTFFLGSDGKLYPYGGIDFSINKYGNNNGNETWQKNCSDSQIASKTLLYEYCTGRVVQNGYKIDY